MSWNKLIGISVEGSDYQIFFLFYFFIFIFFKFFGGGGWVGGDDTRSKSPFVHKSN